MRLAAEPAFLALRVSQTLAQQPPRYMRSVVRRAHGHQIMVLSTSSRALAQRTDSADHISQALKKATPPRSSMQRYFSEPFDILSHGMTSLAGAMWSVSALFFGTLVGQKPTSRVDIRNMHRLKHDIVRIPTPLVFLVMPWFWPVLPSALGRFTGLFPSSFYTDSAYIAKLKRSHEHRSHLGPKIVADYSKFAQKLEATDPSDFHVRKWGQMVAKNKPSYGDFLVIYPMIKTHGNCLNLPLGQAASMTSYLGKTVPYYLPRLAVAKWAHWIVTDDTLIRREGVNQMSDFELCEALEERGFIELHNKSREQLIVLMNKHLQYMDHVFRTVRQVAATEAARLGKGALAPEVDVHGLTALDYPAIGTLLILSRSFMNITSGDHR
ncbi:uncharacterized protein BJ171DRAFT_529544 [Polychytrium aggregatum]|uniref:uncharacterized protein n=1 Tax=Polychytrium aggregatum TaxID=110093 RepID=UPI0022FE3634|nr:uncharacterized protein BJ171DRAFT_529544 [Polychytrium aggregatum]KAI9193289.1 hypothetical protein BJ171DRAFT_529544 [Polychytrium aggregatum]